MVFLLRKSDKIVFQLPPLRGGSQKTRGGSCPPCPPTGAAPGFKSHYRQRLVQTLVARIDAKKLTQINLKDGVDFTAAAWHKVTPETISHCFAKGGFTHIDGCVNNEVYLTEANEMNIDNSQAQDAVNLHFGINILFKDFVSVDNGIETCDTIDEANIIASISTDVDCEHCER